MVDGKWVGDQYYYGGIGAPDGFGHGHYNADTGYNRPPVNNSPLGWTAIMGALGKSNVDVGGTPWDGRFDR